MTNSHPVYRKTPIRGIRSKNPTLFSNSYDNISMSSVTMYNWVLIKIEWLKAADDINIEESKALNGLFMKI